MVVIQAWRCDFIKIVELFYSPVRNIFPRISSHDLPYPRTTKRQCLSQVSLVAFVSDFSVAPAEILASNILL